MEWSQQEMVGWFFLGILPIAGSVAALIVPIINLNKTITSLDERIKSLVAQLSGLDLKIEKHDKTIDELIRLTCGHNEILKGHEKRICKLEDKE